MPDRVVVYKRVGGGELRLHIFTPAGQGAGERCAAVVFFHGGGWNGGEADQFFPQCEYFASRGMVAMSADYRTATSHGTSPAECVKDGKSALRWVRRHAAELGIDPDRLAAGGSSAGGQMAAAAGTIAGFNEEGEDLSISCRPDVLVLFNPVFDNGPGGYGYERVGEYWREFSPLHNIAADMPPAIVFLGDKDDLIPPATGEEFKRRMTEKGIRCDLHIYANQPHGFFNYANREMFVETVIEADKFLASLGFLTGEPTLSSI